MKVTSGVTVWGHCAGEPQQGSSNAKLMLIPAVLHGVTSQCSMHVSPQLPGCKSTVSPFGSITEDALPEGISCSWFNKLWDVGFWNN